MGIFSFFSPKAPAQHIVKLDRLNEGQALRILFWADVPVDYQKFFADPNATSAFLDATSDEIKALRSGAVAERVVQLNTVSSVEVADPSPRTVLNDVLYEDGRVKRDAAGAAVKNEAYHPIDAAYVEISGLIVKTLVPWDEETLDANLGDEWQRFQDEVNAGLKGGSDFSGYGEANEIASP